MRNVYSGIFYTKSQRDRISQRTRRRTRRRWRCCSPSPGRISWSEVSKKIKNQKNVKKKIIKGLPDRIHDCHQMNMLYPSIPKVRINIMISERNIKNSPLDYFRIRPLENTTAPHRRRYILPDMMAMWQWSLCWKIAWWSLQQRFLDLVCDSELPLSDAAIDSCKKLVANVQGVSKKRYFLGFCLIPLLEVRFYFFTCVSESEFRARFI